MKIWKIDLKIINKILKYKGEKHILVPTFSVYSHFSSYILFLPLLVLILKNASRFGSCRYIRNEESRYGKTTGINNIKLMSTWPILIIKNATSASKLKKLIY